MQLGERPGGARHLHHQPGPRDHAACVVGALEVRHPAPVEPARRVAHALRGAPPREVPPAAQVGVEVVGHRSQGDRCRRRHRDLEVPGRGVGRLLVVDEDRDVAAPCLVVLADQQLAGLRGGAPVDVAQIVARHVLPQRVEGQVAHRELLARRAVQVADHPSREHRQADHLGCDEQLGGDADRHRALHQAQRIGPQVPRRTHGVAPARKAGEREDLLVVGVRTQEREPDRHVTLTHAQREPWEQHRDRAGAHPEAERGRLAAGCDPVRVQLEAHLGLPRHRLPGRRQQHQREAGSAQLGELLPVQPPRHGERGHAQREHAAAGRGQCPPRGTHDPERAHVHARSRGTGTCSRSRSTISSVVVPPKDAAELSSSR